VWGKAPGFFRKEVLSRLETADGAVWNGSCVKSRTDHLVKHKTRTGVSRLRLISAHLVDGHGM